MGLEYTVYDFINKIFIRRKVKSMILCYFYLLLICDYDLMQIDIIKKIVFVCPFMVFTKSKPKKTIHYSFFSIVKIKMADK
jgi:hypothetical protein